MVGKPIERLDRHKDGSIKAKGWTVDDMLTGYWEWFRKDGTKMRSDILKTPNRQANGRPTTPRERSSSHEDEIPLLSSNVFAP